MNKIVASVGLVALSASTVQVLHAASIEAPPSKPYSLGVALRGFYDDNINTAHSGPAKQDAFGVQVSPNASLNWAGEQTTVDLGYTFSWKHYDHSFFKTNDRDDYTHIFNAGLDHNFNERVKLNLNDSFVIGQEPDVLRAGNAFSSFQRVSGDNIRNYGAIDVTAQLTELFGIDVGYGNAFYDYKAEGYNPITGVPSLSGLLDRIEHKAHIDGTWKIMPETTAVLGYEYDQTDFTGDEQIAPSGIMSRIRDWRAHKGYLGLNHSFSSTLSGKVRVGASATDYYNDSSASDKITPYVLASLRYNYTVGSYLEAGFTYDRNATDVLVRDAESAILFASLNHQIMPHLIGRIDAQFQDSSFNAEGTGTGLNNKSERFYLIGLNLKYEFNPYLAAEIGYNYDKLDSDINAGGGSRSFDRNRAYVGISASY